MERRGFAERTVQIPAYGNLLSKAEMCLPKQDPRLILGSSPCSDMFWVLGFSYNNLYSAFHKQLLIKEHITIISCRQVVKDACEGRGILL